MQAAFGVKLNELTEAKRFICRALRNEYTQVLACLFQMKDDGLKHQILLIARLKGDIFAASAQISQLQFTFVVIYKICHVSLKRHTMKMSNQCTATTCAHDLLFRDLAFHQKLRLGMMLKKSLIGNDWRRLADTFNYTSNDVANIELARYRGECAGIGFLGTLEHRFPRLLVKELALKCESMNRFDVSFYLQNDVELLC